ncbi:MAG: peptidyl-prolyl cis-trans isomerase [Candidatus Auribacter fodinae]|uniref:Periplasmic chaperone PpiD n=1 Tax=Candidatus Auribacter fodinae TaxID=2093366 RepID=A0A3A4RB01_9BACT|nr:MAG: peptidyl-prolyl cis-trans isomerase [Candidatus Auribacter fodinae]
MITYMRKRMKMIFIIILLAIIPGFTLWGIVSVVRAPREQAMGEINGRKVLENEYRQAYLATYWNARLSNRQLEGDQLNEMAWNRLIMLDEAKKYGLSVSDEEVARFLHRIFRRNNMFDKQLYIEILRRENISPAMYEEETRKSLIIEKLNEIMLGGAKVSDYEAYLDYVADNEKLTIEYVKFDVGNYMDSIKPDAQDLESFYQENSEKYKKPDEVNAKYVEVLFADHMPEEEISDNDARAYYDNNTSEYVQQKEVKARHILLKLDETAGDDVVEKVRASAQEILDKALAGEDFAELAKQYSEGPTGPNGGDLGFFGRGAMVKPFEDAAFETPAGEIYPEPVRTRFGFHIIKVDEVKEEVQKSFEEVQEEVKQKIKQLAAESEAQAVIQEIYYKSDDLRTMEQAAAESGIEVKETGFFSSPYDIPGVGVSQEFRQSAFEVDAFNISQIVETDKGYYLVSPIERRSGVIPNLTDVLDAVERAYKRDKALELASADAVQASSAIKTAMANEKVTFAEAAEKAGYKAETSTAFSRRSPDPILGYDPELGNTLFVQKEGAVTDPVNTSNGVLVAHILKYETPTREEFDAKKDDVLKQFSFEKKYMAFQEWFNKIKQDARLIDLTKYGNQQ